MSSSAHEATFDRCGGHADAGVLTFLKRRGGGPFSIVAARVPSSFVQSLYSDVAHNMQYLHVSEDQLGEFNRLAEIYIHDSVPIAQWP